MQDRRRPFSKLVLVAQTNAGSHVSEINFYTANAALADKQSLDVPSLELIYQLERSGEVFYNMLADRVQNEEAATLLRKNAVEERAHSRRVARALSIKLGRDWEPTAEIDEILPIPMPETIDADLFLGVVQGELRGDAGYQNWADNEENEDVARLLRLNGREETIHAGRARQVHELLSR